MGMMAHSMSIKLIPNNHLFSSYSSSAILFINQTGFFSKWKTFFNNQNNIDRTIKPFCIHGYRGEELIEVWNNIYQTNLTLTPTNILASRFTSFSSFYFKLLFLVSFSVIIPFFLFFFLKNRNERKNT
jgi:predicted PurR-regulated permease PerM